MAGQRPPSGVRVSISVCVMGRVLRRLGARRGNPKPVVLCPLSNRQQRRRLAKIRRMIAELPARRQAVGQGRVKGGLWPQTPVAVAMI